MVELQTKGITNACHDEVKDLFPLLEVTMEPLELAKRLGPTLEFISSVEELQCYAEPIKRVAIFRLLEKLSVVYDVMKISEVEKVASFTTLAEVRTQTSSESLSNTIVHTFSFICIYLRAILCMVWVGRENSSRGTQDAELGDPIRSSKQLYSLRICAVLHKDDE